LKYVYISIATKKVQSPSEEVDLVWHHALENVVEYHSFCKKFLGIRMFAHNPSDGTKEDSDKYHVIYENTRDTIKTYFGDICEYAWPNAEKRFSQKFKWLNHFYFVRKSQQNDFLEDNVCEKCETKIGDCGGRCGTKITNCGGDCGGRCGTKITNCEGGCDGSCGIKITNCGGDCGGRCGTKITNCGGDCGGRCGTKITNCGGDCGGRCGTKITNCGGPCGVETCGTKITNCGGPCGVETCGTKITNCGGPCGVETCSVTSLTTFVEEAIDACDNGNTFEK